MRKLKLQELQRPALETFRQMPKVPVRLVLDNIRSGLNVGSAFRTADAFALEGICLCGITAQPPHREILKTAIGATESVAWSYHPSVVEVVRQLKQEGYRVLAVEQTDQSISLADLRIEPSEKYALIFGNEVEGVNEEVLSLVDGAVEIPQFGTKHSLNVAVCIGVVTWELVRGAASLGQGSEGAKDSWQVRLAGSEGADGIQNPESRIKNPE